VDLGDQEPLRRRALVVTDSVHVSENPVAFLDERAHRDLPVGEESDAHPVKRLGASATARDLAVLVGESAPIDVVGQQCLELIEPAL
jgi:hypothetical protein